MNGIDTASPHAAKAIRLLAFAGAALLAPQAAFAATSCDALGKLKLKDIEIVSAVSVEGSLPEADLVPSRGPGAKKVNPHLLDLPAFCRVNAILKPAPGSRIGMELWLPTKWNGKLLGIGSHGFGGNIERGDMGMGLHRGYAVVTSDLGHANRYSEIQGGFNVGDASFAVGNKPAVEDFAWRATHEMTVAAKGFVKRFYGVGPSKSYFNGCSNGGRQAMREAQQFPKDYDGIIAGGAAMSWTRSFAATLAYFQAGLLPSGAKLTMPKLQLAQKAEIAACDKLDGLADGLIADPGRCTWKAPALLCQPGSDPAACLTAEEAAAIDRIRAPVTMPNGELIYPGLYAGGEAQWRNALGFNLVTSNFYRHMVMNDANWTPDARTDLYDVLRRSEAPGSAGPLINSMNPDLSAFRARGGKLIQYHGWSDPSFGPGYAPIYYAEVVDLQRGDDKLAATQDFYRLFMAPGMAHCYGGEGPINFGALDHLPSPKLDADHDILEALDRWVEKGAAPKRIIATQYSKDQTPERQMPICPWPQVAIFSGSDAKRAESFTCAAPGRNGTTG